MYYHRVVDIFHGFMPINMALNWFEVIFTSVVLVYPLGKIQIITLLGLRLGKISKECCTATKQPKTLQVAKS